MSSRILSNIDIATAPKNHNDKHVLPTSGRVAAWPIAHPHSTCRELGDRGALNDALAMSDCTRAWEWPSTPLYFISDPHADADAFVASLIATGCVDRRGPSVLDFELNAQGRLAEFVIGGDCLDKGPANLPLLRAIKSLSDLGARVTILAGNHDLRLWLGLSAIGLSAAPETEHLFLRMGPKVVPLLREVHDMDANTACPPGGIPDERACRRAMYPSADWFERFPLAMRERLSTSAIERELLRMRRKAAMFASACAEAGLTLRHAYAAALRCRQLFLDRDGEFAWFFRDMRLLSRRGSLLFVHAGIDDELVAMIAKYGIDGVNAHFRWQATQDLSGLFYGPLRNAFRTKYRLVDRPLTVDGVARAHRLGIRLIVHGHRNRTMGQRLALRQGMMHMECDVTLDRNSRRDEGLRGIGAGATIVHPDGYIVGISNDYPEAKLFEPSAWCPQASKRDYAA